ncbi:MAG: energy transducer TonB, partial [Rhodanobacteraceae bacterium]
MASSTDNAGKKAFSWRRTIAIAFAVAIHSFAFLLMVAPVSPPQAKEKAKSDVVKIEFIEPPPPPPPPP